MKYNLIKIREGRVEDLTNVFNLIKELAKYENAYWWKSFKVIY